MESFLRRSSICSVGVLSLALAARLPAQVPQPPPPQEEDEKDEEKAPQEPEAKPKGEAKPPEGILPVGEVTRLSFAPSELPKVLLHADRLVVVTASGGVEGHDAVTGEFRWKLGLPGETLFEPVLHRTDPFEILLSSASGHLFVVDAATGQIRRELQLPCELALAPLVALPFLYVGTPQGELLAFDAETGAERFRVPLGEPPAALETAGGLLVASGSERMLVATNAATGAEAWRFQGRSGFFAPAVFASDRLYIGNDAGEFYCLSLEDGGVRFHWPTGASIRYAALLEDRLVYVTSYGNDLYAYHARRGAEQLRVSLPGRPASRPVRFGRRLVVVTFDGAIIEIDPEKAAVSKVHQSPGDLAARPAFLPAAPSPGTKWFEAHRIALSLRTGEVLLLAHQGSAEEEPKEETPDETDENDENDGKKKPKPPPEDSVSRK